MTTFLNNYIAMTNDDPTIISISYYDLNLQSSIDYSPSNTKVNIMVTNSAKACRCSGNSNLGASLNSTIAKIQTQNFNSGISKIIVAIVGTTSLDDVQFASEYARALGITIIVIAVGSSYSSSQLLQATSTSSNLLFLPNYSDLDNFPSTFQNFLNKQYVDVLAGSSLIGSIVKVPSNPNYYRIPRSTVGGTYHKVTLTFSTDPAIGNMQVYTSHYDPFPDMHSNCNCT